MLRVKYTVSPLSAGVPSAFFNKAVTVAVASPVPRSALGTMLIVTLPGVYSTLICAVLPPASAWMVTVSATLPLVKVADATPFAVVAVAVILPPPSPRMEKLTMVPPGGAPPPTTVSVALMVAVDVPSAGRLAGLAVRLMVAICVPIRLMAAVPETPFTVRCGDGGPVSRGYGSRRYVGN